MKKTFFITVLILSKISIFCQVNFYSNPTVYSTNISSALGAFNTFHSNCAASFASGYSHNLGANCNSAHALGESNHVNGLTAFSIGRFSKSMANHSMSLGYWVTSNSEYSITIGHGIWSSNYSNNLTNNIENSLMVGFNSNIPTFFVGSASGLNTIGTVGIGTTDTKGHTLGVKGSIIAERIVVDYYADWPDYVFNKNYQLMKIENVEKYIKDNSHLPGVPSSKKVSEEGYDLTEMDAILLKKIEELTLYIIELQKEINTLKKQN